MLVIKRRQTPSQTNAIFQRLISYLFVIMSLVLIAHYFWKVPGWIVWLVGLATYLYLFLAIKKFYQQSFFLSFLKTGLTTFIYLLFVLPIALGIMVAASFLFY